MKVICDRSALLEILNLVGGVVVTRTPKPAMSCVKLTADGASMTVEATDLEVGLRMTLAQVQVSQAGEALIPADKFAQIVRESVDPTLDLQVDQNVTHIRGQDSHFQVIGQPPDDFPGLPEFENQPDFEASAEDLHKQITETVFATARENSRYAINGVLIERQANKLSLVATDGRRLALSRGRCKSVQDENRSAIVPSKALQMLQKLVDEPEQTVRVRVADNQIVFETPEAMLVSNLVEGSFPPYQDVIPQDSDRHATIDVAVLTSGVRRAQLLTNEESKGVRFNFSPDGLTLTSRAPEMGEAEIKVALAGYEGESIEIGFNPQFILDALKIVPDEQVGLDLKASNKPGVMRCGTDFLYVIMPVNLQ